MLNRLGSCGVYSVNFRAIRNQNRQAVQEDIEKSDGLAGLTDCFGNQCFWQDFALRVIGKPAAVRYDQWRSFPIVLLMEFNFLKVRISLWRTKPAARW